MFARVLILLLLLACPVLGQTRIRDLDSVTAGGIEDDTAVLFGVDKTDVPDSFSFSLAELKKTGMQVANIYQYGAVADGSNNDRTALVNALASGLPVYIPVGADVKFDTAITHAGDVIIFGGGTITCSSAGTALQITGSLRADDITFDGDDACERMVYVICADAEDVYLTRCRFTNMDSATFCSGFQADNVRILRIVDCQFDDITALGNAVEGDTDGVSQSVYLTGDIANGVIDRCYFNNVHTVNATPVNIWEDANAIHAFAATTEKHNLTVSRCRFNDIGKRALKAQGDTGSFYTVRDCHVISGWTGLADLVGTTNNGMYAAVDFFGGHALVDNLRTSGGGIRFMVSCSTADLDSIKIINCVHNPEDHIYVHGTNTAGVHWDATIAAGKRGEITKCTIANVWQGVNQNGIDDSSITDNSFTVMNNCCPLVAATGRHSFTGNVVLQDSYNDPGGHYAVYLSPGVASLDFSGNHIAGKRDGLLVPAQSAAFLCIAQGNRFAGVTRNGIRNEAGTTYSGYVIARDNQNDAVGILAADTDTTPSVADREMIRTANTMATSITDFDNEIDGQRLTVAITDANTTIVDGAPIALAGNANFAPGAGGGTISFLNVQGVWYETARADFVP